MTTCVRALTLGASLVAVAGCASMSTMGTARNLEEGRTRIVPGMAVVGSLTGRTDKGTSVLAQLELGVAHGVHPRVELGGKAWFVPGEGVWSWGVEAHTRLQLLRARDPQSGVDIALLPRVSFAQLGSGGTLYHTIAADVVGLVGVNLGERHQLVFGVPILGIQTWLGEGVEPLESLRVGASLGISLVLSGCFGIMPELAFVYDTLEVDKGQPTALFQATVSVHFEP